MLFDAAATSVSSSRVYFTVDMQVPLQGRRRGAASGRGVQGQPPGPITGASSAEWAVGWGVWVNEGGSGGLRRLGCEVDHMSWVAWAWLWLRPIGLGHCRAIRL